MQKRICVQSRGVKKGGTFLGSTPKKSVGPHGRQKKVRLTKKSPHIFWQNFHKSFVTFELHRINCRFQFGEFRPPCYTATRQRTSGTKTKHSRRSPAPGKCKIASADRPIAKATAECCDSLKRLGLKPQTQTPQLQTPTGQSSAFPDTPRDHLHVIATTRGDRENTE